MKLTKIKIKNLFGIKEYESDGNNKEITGDNGTGKTSVLDAIKYGLSNKSDRDYIIRDGESEGEILIETDTGILINRKARVQKADYKSIKENDKSVSNPEAFLRDIFTELQLNPIEFIHMTKPEQNRIILDMIDFEWDLNWIKDQFGEIVPDINYSQNILQVLNDIQADDGYYFTTRQDINRDIRNGLAFIEEIGLSLPANYNAKNWKNFDIGEIYTKIEKARQQNANIYKAKQFIENVDGKIRSFDADKEIAINVIEKTTSAKRENITLTIQKLNSQIKELETERDSLEESKISKIKVVKSEFTANTAELTAKISEYKPLSEKKLINTSRDEEKAATAKNMMAHINEYERMVRLQEDNEKLKEQSQAYTEKIEHARNIPAEILEKSNIPIKGITVKDGMPLINGLPISNLSEGEKLNLCIDVSIANKKGLNILLLDGIERLSKKNSEILYKKLKKLGVQFISTRTDNNSELIVREL